MVCELNTQKELSLSEFIKILYEFNNIDALTLCVKTLKDKYTLDEVKDLSDEELYKYFVEAENSLQ
ncbi:MAG: hypothetical protein IJJ11_06610 [Methanosphaera sp.]|uniref:hypothetical protein n=1 Tax=Methanosphaera sp. BMS TaxID=1789762 RepID=UPI000DC1CD3A|nr:hypothetical protein [Methanosphaera sp. BMS]AWX32157.1 hypothetical protein AW729_03160 [Methanosphaera sp. BMS]MBQ6444332.1 hypothetical protein [Methanosphaera sp.]MBR3213569.1 hypothetical protein [Methanosphaera sp.]